MWLGNPLRSDVLMLVLATFPDTRPLVYRPVSLDQSSTPHQHQTLHCFLGQYLAAVRTKGPLIRAQPRISVF